MGSRVLICALLTCVAFGSAASRAADTDAGYQPRHRRLQYYSGGGYYGQIGGQRYGYQNRTFINQGSNYNYPGHYNNQTFWERVQTQAQYPVQY